MNKNYITKLTPSKKQKEIINSLQRWLKRGKLRFNFLQFSNFRKDKKSIDLFLYSKTYEYHIFISENYIGASYITRKPIPGENWNRGRDLFDGKFNEESFKCILFDIVMNECYQKNKYFLNFRIN